MTSRVLMCEPLHYRIAYEINPWMRLSNAVETSQAHEQWWGLLTVLEGLGVDVQLVEPKREVPDMTFTANAGVVFGQRFIPANFRFPERQPEAALFTTWFEKADYDVETIHDPHAWEGEGDVLWDGGRVFAGYRFRTDYRSLDHLDEILGVEAVRLELTDPRFYHLDTCFCPLGEGRALYYPPAFSRDSRDLLETRFDRLVAVPEADALRFACNAVAVDGTVVLNTGCDATEAALRDFGFATAPTATGEFIKAGGSVKCLVLTLDSFV